MSSLSSRLPSLEQVRDERCKRDPLYWAQGFTKTENFHYLQQGLEFKAPFPQKSYFAPVFEAFKKHDRLFMPKTREMLSSWCACLWATNRAQWYKAFVVIQAQKEEKAAELIEYCHCLYRNQEPWLKAMHPLASEPSRTEINWADGGRILGVPKGIHQIRSFHPTLLILDEAAFLEEAEQCYNAANPVTKQIIAISSAGPGWFGDQCSR